MATLPNARRAYYTSATTMSFIPTNGDDACGRIRRIRRILTGSEPAGQWQRIRGAW